jgi:hypothetical protein
VSETRVLRRIFGPKGEEVVGGWRRLLNEELHNLYTSPNIIRVIKSRKMGGVCSTHTKYWSKNLKGRDHSEDKGVDGMIMLEGS